MNIVGGLILGSALASSAEVEARREVGEYRLCVPADEWQAVALVVGARVCWLTSPSVVGSTASRWLPRLWRRKEARYESGSYTMS